MYKIFVAEKRGRLIQVKSTDNIFLPQDFIDTLRENYPPNLIRAYIEGEFVNLTSGSVFPYFDRVKNHANIEIGPEDKELYLGADFNSGGCANIKAIMQDGKLYIFGEMLTKDTFETRDRLKSDHPGCTIYGCVDATGVKTTSNSSQSDIDILSEAGVTLIMGQANPHINDSLLSCNNAFTHNNVYIDTIKCPMLTQALEQHAFDAKTGKPDKMMGGGTTDDWTDAFRYLVWVTFPVTKISFSSYNSLGNLKR